MGWLCLVCLISRVMNLTKRLCRTFRVSFSENSSLTCAVTRLERAKGQLEPTVETYAGKGEHANTFVGWATRVIDSALLKQPSPTTSRA